MSYVADKIIKNPKAIITTHTSQQTSSSNANTEVILSGSEITYSPDPNATKVVYEIMFYSEIINDNGFIGLELQHYVLGTWTEIDARFTKNMGNGTAIKEASTDKDWKYPDPTTAMFQILQLACLYMNK